MPNLAFDGLGTNSICGKFVKFYKKRVNYTLCRGIECNRKKTRKIYVGNIPIGGDSRITVQSMTNTQTQDIKATVNQILKLEEQGCEIIRVAVPDWRRL